MLCSPALRTRLICAIPLLFTLVILPGIGVPPSLKLTVPLVTGTELTLTVAVNVIGIPIGALWTELVSVVRKEGQEIWASIWEYEQPRSPRRNKIEWLRKTSSCNWNRAGRGVVLIVTYESNSSKAATDLLTPFGTANRHRRAPLGEIPRTIATHENRSPEDRFLYRSLIEGRREQSVAHGGRL